MKELLEQIEKFGWFEHTLSAGKKDFRSSEISNAVGENEFFMVALALAMAVYNGTDNTALQWVFNGRTDRASANAAGLLYNSMQLFSYADAQKTVQEYLGEIGTQVTYTIAHNALKSSEALGQELEDTVFFLYQHNMFGAKLDYVAQNEEIVSENAAADSYMEFEILDNDGAEEFLCTVKYSASHYKADSIEAFFRIYDKIVSKLTVLSDLERTTLGDVLGQVKKQL